MRRCLVHIGTHKTGTTAIQASLVRARAALARHGFLYPEAGIPVEFGHHAVAWEISGDHSHPPQAKAVDALLAEIEGSDQDVVLSSEDFECAVHHPIPFGRFIDRLRRHTPKVALVIYLRDQVSYVRSLYFELLLHQGLGMTFDDFVSRVMAERIIRWKDWTFSFCYRELLDRLPSGVDVIVRSHDAVDSAVGDFVSLLGMEATDLGIDASLRLNRQASVSAAFAAFCRNRLGRSVEPGGAGLTPIFVEELAHTSIDMSAATRRKLAAAFADSNRLVMSRYALPEFPSMRLKDAGSISEATDRPSLETVFSTTTLGRVEGTEVIPTPGDRT